MIAVVEGHHDRLAGGQLGPGRVQLARSWSSVTAVQPARFSALHLGGELGGRHVQAGKRGAGRRRCDHVVHEDRNGDQLPGFPVPGPSAAAVSPCADR